MVEHAVAMKKNEEMPYEQIGGNFLGVLFSEKSTSGHKAFCLAYEISKSSRFPCPDCKITKAGLTHPKKPRQAEHQAKEEKTCALTLMNAKRASNLIQHSF